MSERAARDGGIQVSAVSWSLWEVLMTADEAEHVVAHRLGLPYTDSRALGLILIADRPLGPGDLGRRLGISSASATVLVDRLVDRGYVYREADPVDARRRVLHATPHGEAAAVTAMTPLFEALDAVAASFDERDAQTIGCYLDRIAEVHRQYSSERASSIRPAPGLR